MFSPVWVIAAVTACDTVCGAELVRDAEEVVAAEEVGRGTRGADNNSSIGNDKIGSDVAEDDAEGVGASKNAVIEQTPSTNALNTSFLPTKSVSQLISTIAALVPITVTPIRPCFVSLPPTFAAFLSPDEPKSVSNHSNASGMELFVALSASRAFDREMGLCLRSSAMRAMGTLRGWAGVLSKRGDVVKERRGLNDLAFARGLVERRRGAVM